MHEIHHGDCIEVMRSLPAESVDAVITSPPYAMQRKSTYGGIPESEYPSWTVQWMTEAKRLLKPDGSVIINISPHRRQGNLSDYVLRTRLALRENGWIEPDELIWHKPNATPGNPPDRPRRAWEHLLWFAKHGKAHADPYAAGLPYTDQKRGMKRYQTDTPAKRQGWNHSTWGSGKAEMKEVARVTNVATFAKASRSGYDHPAPFPWKLAEWCGKLICQPGGTVLDPFSGSASTGVACLVNGWDYIGIDAVKDYVEMSRRRLEEVEAGLDGCLLIHSPINGGTY